MTLEEFNTETTRLEKFYGKQLEMFERDIWFKELRGMSFKRYEQIVKQIFTENKFMPKLADIIALHKVLQYPADTKKQIEECKRCENRGFIIYQKLENGMLYDYVAKCTCKNAEPYSAYPSIDKIGL